MEQYKISKDFFKSTIFHFIIIIIIGVVGFWQSKVTFLTPKAIGMPKNVIVNSKDHPQSYPVKASLIDHNMVQQAIKRQELQVSEKINREKKLEQQEQQVTNLKKAAEQEALKAKQEMQKVKEYKKQLEKEYDVLQQSSKKLKQQTAALSLEQEKLKQQAEAKAKAKAKAQAQSQSQANVLSIEKKKNQKSLENKAEGTKNEGTKNEGTKNEGTKNEGTKNSDTVNSNNSTLNNPGSIKNEVSNYNAKWKNEIINNRKKIMFFPNNITCSFKIKLLPNGHLALVKIEQSSGNLAYDKFSEQAIYKSAPFEMSEDPVLNKELLSQELIIDFKDESFSD